MDKNILIFGGSIALIGLGLTLWQVSLGSRVGTDWPYSKRRHIRRLLIGFVFFLVGACLICNAFQLFVFDGHPYRMLAYMVGLIVLALYAVCLAVVDAFETLRVLGNEMTRLIGPLEKDVARDCSEGDKTTSAEDSEMIRHVKSLK